MAKPTKTSLLSQAIEAVENDEMIGFCTACGEQSDEVEPDARLYECESCGAEKVYGAEELILMLS